MHKHSKPVNNARQEKAAAPMMYIRMLSSMAGPGFRAKAGQIVHAEIEEAKRLIDSGNAKAMLASEVKEDTRAPVLGEYRHMVEDSQRRVTSAGS